MPGIYKCYYADCQSNNKNSHDLHFFTFPSSDHSRCCTWLVNTGRDDLIDLSDKSLRNRRICGRHFKREDFTNSLCNRLNKTAVPIPYIKYNNASQTESGQSSTQELIHKCRRCEKGFAKRDNLSKHLKTNCQSKSETVECKPDIPDLGINYKENAASFRDSKKTATTSTAVTPTNAASSNFEISNNETVKTIIKEEIDADEDDSIYSPTVSRDGDQMEFEDSFIDDQEPTEDPLADNSSDIKFNIRQRRPAKNVATEKVANTSREKADKSTNTEKFQGLSNILGIADSLALDIENILTDDICNFFEVNPMQSRRQIPRPTSDKEPTLSDLKSKCAELELKLRIHYLKDMIKHEEEISNLKKEVNRLQIVKEKMEIENNRDAHLQRMENLKLEHALLNLHLLNRAK